MEAATGEEYGRLVSEWHARRLQLATKAKPLFVEVAKKFSASTSQGRVAAAYAAIAGAIQQEAQDQNGH